MRLLALVPLVCALWGPAEASARSRSLTLLAAGAMDGRLAAPACRDAQTSSPTLALLAASLARARADAESDGRTVIAALHLGDLSGPAALGRFVLEAEGGPRKFAQLVGRAGFTHLLLGNHFLDHPAGLVAELGPALAQAGLTVLNANVACDGRADCGVYARLPASARLVVDGLEIELLGATVDALFTSLDPVARKGLSLKPFSSTVEDRAGAARTAGAELVIAATHAVNGRSNLATAIGLARQLGSVDLLVTNHLGEATRAVATVQPGGGPGLAASGEVPDAVTRLDLDVEESSGRAKLLRISAVRVAALVPEPALAAELATLVRAYCDAWDEPLASVAPSVVDGRGFLAFLLDRLRDAAPAEVAAVNEGLADLGPFPLVAPLSRADVYEALPYDDQVVRADVHGSWLRALWRRAGPASAAPQRLLFEGLVERDGGLWVNDRPLADEQRYTLALPDYVARGGDDLIGGPLEFKEILHDGAPLRLREVALRALADADVARLLITGEGIDLGARPRWSWSGGLTASALDTRLGNETEYPTETGLAKQRASTLRGEATGRLDVEARDHSARLTGRAAYAHTSITGALPIATEDQLFSEALYRQRAIRRLLDEAWYAPVPYLSGRADSEFVANTPPGYHHLELGATVGLRLMPVRPLEIKAGAGVRRELLDPAGRARYGLELGYELPRFSPLKLLGLLPVDVESNLDYFASDLGGDNRQEARFRARLLLPLGGPLAVSAGFDLFLLKRGAQPVAFASDATVGITTRFDGAVQTF